MPLGGAGKPGQHERPIIAVTKAVDAWLRQHGATIYIGSVVVVCGLLGLTCFLLFGWPPNLTGLAVLALLGALTWWLPTSSDGRSHFTADNVVVLAAIPIVGALGAGVVGLVMTGLTTRRIPLRRRVFNMATMSSSAMIGGLAYAWAGGPFNPVRLRGASELLWHVGLPIVIADLVNLFINAVLVAGVIKVTAGVPLMLQLREMLTGSGPTQFAYGIIAFLVVVMWVPGGLGPVAVLVALAPLAGALWALLLYGEERDSRERALGALVTAIETRAPHLEGHSGRVSAMASLMAQELGLGPKEVADVTTAGLLHDLGRVVVAPSRDSTDETDGAALRGAAMLQNLPFLSGASSVMEEVARAGDGVASGSLSAEIVRAADEYDLSLLDGDSLSPEAAIARVRARRAPTPDTERVLGALARVSRLNSGIAATP